MAGLTTTPAHQAYVKRLGFVPLGTCLQVLCMCVDHRVSFGADHVEMAPLMGEGTDWVEAGRVTWADEGTVSETVQQVVDHFAQPVPGPGPRWLD